MSMNIDEATQWMQTQLEKDGCLYQDDAVDKLVKTKSDSLLRENSDGNLVLNKDLLGSFKKLTAQNVVWVRPDLYWRYRVAEDEPGRNARG